MKTLLLGFLLLLTSAAWGQGQTDVFNERGEREGYVREDPYSKDRLEIYDKDSKRTGYMEKDPYSDRYNVYDRDGKRKGYLKDGRLFEK